MIETGNLALEVSGAESMGCLGVGTNPEELLVCAVSSCYIATLVGVLRRAELPVESVTVSAGGTVTGFPGHARFSRITVSPTILGGEVARQLEYEGAVGIARDRCLIGRALASQVAYEVGSVHVRAGAVLATAPAQPLPQSDNGRPVAAIVDQRCPTG
ncbi:MAG: OsmC family protein [Solirubrobacteraceae bacterium]